MDEMEFNERDLEYFYWLMANKINEMTAPEWFSYTTTLSKLQSKIVHKLITLYKDKYIGEQF